MCGGWARHLRVLVRDRKAGGGPIPQQVVGTSPEVAERRQTSVRNAHRSLVGRRFHIHTSTNATQGEESARER